MINITMMTHSTVTTIEPVITMIALKEKLSPLVCAPLVTLDDRNGILVDLEAEMVGITDITLVDVFDVVLVDISADDVTLIDS